MPKVIIIGNSAAGFSCSQELIKNNQPFEITVLTSEDALPYRRSFLRDYLAGNTKEKELYLADEGFYKQNNLTLLRNSTVTKIDTKKQRVSLKDGGKLNYDYLIIASGAREEIPDVQGNNKDGVFALYSLNDFRKIKERLLISDTVCILGEPSSCLAFQEILSKNIKHVKVISSPKPADFVSSESAEWIENLELSEIIGEGMELKALKLKNGKAIGASLVLFTGYNKPCTEFLKDTDIKTESGYIAVDNNMRTNIENIFACGSVSVTQGVLQKQKDWDESVNEGTQTAVNLINILERGKEPCQTY